ncbi:MAG TPA: cupin domain-containing protein [Blastocatellia bacterium]|nr:cupin domain-containing protein [Blastocatellia bacterium]
MSDQSTSPNTNDESQRKVSLQEALAKLPGETGKRFVTLFTHGSLQVEMYAPRGFDPQKPHTRDEVYIVASGQGEYVCAGARQKFEPGDLLFAAAGEAHWFERFSDDFAVWVLFYGPEGGEK